MFSSFSKEYNEIWNNNKKTKSYNINTKINKNNIIYSNELVKDLKILKRCNSLESIDYFLEQRIKSYDMMNHLYSSENYLYSLEEEKKINIIQKFIQWIKNAKNFIVGFFMGVVKKLQVLVLKIYRNSLCSIVKKFKPENFKNLNATLKFKHSYKTPFPSDVMRKKMSDYGDKFVELGKKYIEALDKQNALYEEFITKGLDNVEDSSRKQDECWKEVDSTFLNFFHVDKLKDVNDKNVDRGFALVLRKDIYENYNSNQEIDVKSFLGASEGQEPTALEFFKSDYIKNETDDMKNIGDVSKKIVSDIDKILKKVENNLSKGPIQNGENNKEMNKSMNNDISRNRQQQMHFLKTMILQTKVFGFMTNEFFIEKVNIYRDLHRAISLGLSSPKN